MEIDLSKDIVFVGFDAYGYYSDNYRIVGIACYKEDLGDIIDSSEKLKEKTHYFYELDGKHSEIHGDYVEFEDMGDIIKAVLNRYDGVYALELMGLGDEVFERTKALNRALSSVSVEKSYVLSSNYIKNSDLDHKVKVM